MMHYRTGFSVRNNTISDLGNTACSAYNNRAVCSPWHLLMNISFVILGFTMFFGSLYIYKLVAQTSKNEYGMGAMALAGIGTILVGIFPENTVGLLHAAGAAMPFLVGNAGMIVLGFSLPVPRWLRIYTTASGIFALIALSLFLTNHTFGLRTGGMERLTAYPQTIWLIVAGIHFLCSRPS